MFTDIHWRLLMLETFVMGALCCSCRYDHPQKQFCQSEFVLKVAIYKEIEWRWEKTFIVEIKKVFKGDMRDANLIHSRYALLEMDPDCPVESMKTGDTYVIFGDRLQGSMYTAACYGSMPWENTTVFYRLALEEYYKKNCNCAVFGPNIRNALNQKLSGFLDRT